MPASRPLVPLAVLATSFAVSVGVSLAANGSPSLTGRVLRSGEIAGYFQHGSRLRPLSLKPFVRATGDGRQGGKIMRRYGFVAGAFEDLIGPTPIPGGNGSTSSVIQFATTTAAGAVLRVITNTYYRKGPGGGIKLVRFNSGGIARATWAHFSGSSAKGTINEWQVLFAAGPYFYDEDILSLGSALTQHAFVKSMRDFYQRVR